LGVIGGQTTASAKTRHVSRTRIVSYQAFTTTKYRVKGGKSYTSRKLNKVKYNLNRHKNLIVRSRSSFVVRKANGKHVKYNYIYTRIHGKTKKYGYVLHSKLAKYHRDKKTVKQSATVTADDDDVTDETASDSADQTATQGSKGQAAKDQTSDEKAFGTFSLSQYRATFLKVLNQERTKRGLKPLTEDSKLDQVAQARGPQLVANFSHTDAQGNLYVDALAKKFGTAWFAENIAEVGSGDGDYGTAATIKVDGIYDAADVAKENVYEYIYNDAASDWGHRAAMLNTGYTTIGMGGVYDTATGRAYTAADFGGLGDDTDTTEDQSGSDDDTGNYITVNGQRIQIDSDGQGYFSTDQNGQIIPQ